MTEQSSAINVLLVEDDVSLSQILKQRLQDEGYSVLHTDSVAATQRILNSNIREIELCILDVGLKDGSGFEIAQSIQSSSFKFPVIFITAYSDPEDRVRGLELGGEDYVIKPFHWRELALRISKVLERHRYAKAKIPDVVLGSSKSQLIQIGQCRVDFSAYKVILDDDCVHHLSQKECTLLRLLWERRGQVVSRDEILDFVWSVNEYPTPRTVDNFVVRLRRLVEKKADDPQTIKSVRGVGYQLDAEVTSHA